MTSVLMLIGKIILISHSQNLHVKRKPVDVTLKVLIRCRPFSEDDQLGVFISDRPGEKSEIELVNGEHGSRYAFQYSWWSAFGYEKHMQPDDNGYAAQAEEIPLVSQEDIYKSIGTKMLDLILGGEVVVLFAYGLSGSGKTYTVFGPDMMSDPESTRTVWTRRLVQSLEWSLGGPWHRRSSCLFPTQMVGEALFHY